MKEDRERSRYPNVKVCEVAGVTDGQHGYHEVDETSRIWMLTAKNAKSWFANTEGADHIAEWVHINNKRSSLAVDDLILSTRGTVGLCALVTEEVLPANIDQDVARITLLDKARIKPAYCLAYLNSSFGQDYITRQSSGMVQQGLSLSKVEQIPIPILSDAFQSSVEITIRQALSLRRHSFDLYFQAERNLLCELALLSWQPPEPLTYEQKSSDVFTAERIDAEYFQPKYAELFRLLSTKGDIRLGDCVTEKIRRGISPAYVDEGGDIIVINSKHVGKVYVETENNRQTTRALLEERADEEDINEDQPMKRGEVKVGDVLLNSTGMITIGRCQCLLDDLSAVVDNHVAIIRPVEEIDPIYLACFLNTLPGQMQTERGWTGSSGQIELRPDVIADYRIWKAPAEFQQNIRSLIEMSHAQRREAKYLLEAAKRAVEIAIEESEEMAIAFLETNRKKG